jgi:hypothetical protein
MESIGMYERWTEEIKEIIQKRLTRQQARPIEEVLVDYRLRLPEGDMLECDLFGVFTHLASWLPAVDASFSAVESQVTDGREYKASYDIAEYDGEIHFHFRALACLRGAGDDYDALLGIYCVHKIGDGKFVVLFDNNAGFKAWVDFEVNRALGIESSEDDDLEGDEEDITYMFPDGIPDFYATPGMEGATFYGVGPTARTDNKPGEETKM